MTPQSTSVSIPKESIIEQIHCSKNLLQSFEPSDRAAGKGKLPGCELATTKVKLESMILRPGRLTIMLKYDLQHVSFYVWHHRTERVNFAIFETVASHPFRIILLTHEGGEYAIQRKKRTH
jgi:hypothetical protein